jgi:riboflavin biosynthesis pyrimidine reductase
MVGAATVQAERYGTAKPNAESRTRRERDGYSPAPPLVVVTASASLPATLPLFDPDGPRTIVATLAASAERADELRQVADVVVVGEEEIDPARILAELTQRGLRRILCEGGPYMLSQLIDRDLVDEMCLTLAPFLAGSQPTTMQPASDLVAPTRLGLKHVLTSEDMLYLRYTRG